MITIKSKSLDAVEIANKIIYDMDLTANIKNEKIQSPRRILAFIDQKDWEKVKGKDEVDTLNNINDDEYEYTLEALKEKEVVFCIFPKFDADFITWSWKSFTGGNVVKVSLC